ncbi:hypothetical protein KFK14_05355 [Sphingobium phenoxybenzoativorans]|uniref:Uncharacterized protein n=1 Tax=Sphingobium phenoxybenzoativorans TaxID=1592790 RepID=A0A975Q2W7_9SPHN|nr:hypothetical protein [Sphingobium phenoxybenzoativorans]QUT06868.1 hypothetical protein KFK14_05355 [Sphingobium phenoxybenzoativorans]
MQRPNPGDLLRGLRRGLEEQVLPAVPKGVPYQQLKAALHLIGRLERCWDTAASHLASDNADIQAVLSGLLPQSGAQSLQAQLLDVPASVVTGFNDPDLAAAAKRNLELHHVLAKQDTSAEIQSLYERMVARDAIYVGDTQNENRKGQ